MERSKFNYNKDLSNEEGSDQAPKPTNEKTIKKKLSIKDIGPSKLIMLALCGIFLIVLSVPGLFSSNKTTKDEKLPNDTASQDQSIDSSTIMTTDEYTTKLEERLKEFLSNVDGIGEVEVMITLQSSKELITLKNSPYTQESLNETDGEGGSRISSSSSREDSTVLVTTEDGENIPYIIKEIEPLVEGVVVVAEGGANAIIAKDIVEAVGVLFDVPAHKVKVMKKSQ